MPRIAAGTSFNEASAKALLGKIGVASPVERVVDSPDEVAATARTMRLPLALKIVSSDILHKTEIGGVKIAITSPEDAAAEAGQMAERIARAAPAARLDGFLLSQLAPPGVDQTHGTPPTTPYA